MLEGYGPKQKESLLSSIGKLKNLTGYSFKNLGLIAQALTHSSYANETMTVNSYERLEFLGDAVLELCVSDRVFKLFKSCSEGELTKLRANLVCEASLSRVAKEMGLGPCLILGVGAAQTGSISSRSSTLCDMFEALIGAIYVDGGIEEAWRFIDANLIDKANLTETDFSPNDYKGKFQDLCQKSGKNDIKYKITDEKGPDHEKHFQAAVFLNGKQEGQGEGKSKKEAEQNAALCALKKMGLL